jgi:hypothetical protein
MRFLFSLLAKAQTFRPAGGTLRRLGFVAAFFACSAVAFWYGRQQAPRAAANAITPATDSPSLTRKPLADYSRRLVAEIHGSEPITREDLGEFLIARFGAERLDFLVNSMIVDRACRAKGIEVSDAEVEAQLRDEVRGYGMHMTPDQFEKDVLKRFNKTLYEWKEDVIRPKIALAKLCRPTISVSEGELKKAYEAKFGPKVEVRVICFLKDDSTFLKVYNEAKESEEKFSQYARKQGLPHLAALGGKVPPIHKHFGAGLPADKEMEKEAFSLKEGEVSKLIELPDGMRVMMRCDKRIPADALRTYAMVRLDLEAELKEQKLAAKIPDVFDSLRKAAEPKIYLRKTERMAALPPPLPAPSAAPVVSLPPLPE